MQNPTPENFTEERAHALLEVLALGNELISIALAPGSFSNFTHFVEARSKDGDNHKFAVRRYKIFSEYDRGEKAHREFKTFQLLNQHNIPTPEALLLDESGDILGSPGIVTRFVEGSLVLDTPADPLDWARKLACTLAKIHTIPCGDEEKKFLLEGNSQATWFLNDDTPPEYMQNYPRGADVWQTLRDNFAKIDKVSPSLLHIDYWSGNILWHEHEIAAVIDWEEASYGDPAYDVAYTRMNMNLMGLPDAADEFIRVYESETGRALKNLGFWELAASVRPMTDPEDWNVVTGKGFDILQQFITDAKRRI